MDWQKYTTCFYYATWRVSQQLFIFCWGMCLFEQWNKGTWFVWIMWRETNTVNNMCTDWCNRSSLMKWESYMKRSGRINSIQSMRPTHWEMRCFCQLLQGSRESTWPMGGFRFLGRMPCCHVAMLLHVDFFGYSRRLSLHLRWWVDSLVAVLSDSNSILVSCTSLLCCASWCESSIDSKSGHASKYPCQWQTWIFAIVTCGERHGQPERATWKYPSKEIPKQWSSKTR